MDHGEVSLFVKGSELTRCGRKIMHHASIWQILIVHGNHFLYMTDMIIYLPVFMWNTHDVNIITELQWSGPYGCPPLHFYTIIHILPASNVNFIIFYKNNLLFIINNALTVTCSWKFYPVVLGNMSNFGCFQKDKHNLSDIKKKKKLGWLHEIKKCGRFQKDKPS